MSHEKYEEYQDCIAACHACAVACNHCAAACLQEDDVKMMAGCIALDIDCAAICRVAAGVTVNAFSMASSLWVQPGSRSSAANGSIRAAASASGSQLAW